MRLAKWLAVAMVLWPSVARADIVPPEDHECTMKNVVLEGDKCVSCIVQPPALETCREQYGNRGYVHRCSGSGKGRWTEIWCLPQAGAVAADAGRPLEPMVEPSEAAQPATAAPPVASPSPDALASPMPSAGASAASGSASAGAVGQAPGGAVAPGGRGCGSCVVKDERPTGRLASGVAAVLVSLTVGGRLVLRARRTVARRSRTRAGAQAAARPVHTPPRA